MAQAPQDPPEFVDVLLISSAPEDHVSLIRIFAHSNWRLRQVTTCHEAVTFVSENDTSVVICERDLPDGDWKFLLSGFDGVNARPTVIVTSRRVDEALWAEVLNLGGYDVLAQPFDPEEVHRVVFLAWHHRRSHPPASAKRAAALDGIPGQWEQHSSL